MSYDAQEEALAREIAAIEGFGESKVARNDWLPLGHGHDVQAVLEYQSFNRRSDSLDGDEYFVWTMRVHLYGRYTTDKDTRVLLNARRQEIIDRVLGRRTLGGDAFDAFPVRGSWAAVQEVAIGGISFLHEFIEIAVEERVEYVALAS